MNLFKIKRIIRIKEEKKYFEDDVVAIEFELTIIINGQKFVKLVCTPNDLEELVIGYLYTEGVIKSMLDIKHIGIVMNSEDSGVADVEMAGNTKFIFNDEETSIIRTVTSACGNNRTFILKIFNCYNRKTEPNDINYAKINEIMSEFNKKSKLFIDTGGVHSSALTDMSKIMFFSEDIGRHNAVDKIIGKSIKDEVDINNKILITSGRISSEIIYKCLASNIYTIISRSAPTTRAVEIGDEFGMTIIGFARGNRYNIYTCLNQYI